MKLRAGLERPFVGILIVLALSLGCSATRAQRAAATAEGGPEGESFGGGFRVIGVLWYLRSHAAMDDLTLVYGGLRGSAALVYRDCENKTSYWTFLDGKDGSSVFISKDSTSPDYTSTSKRGWFITSVRDGGWQPEKDGNRRELSWALADLFELSQAAPGNPATEGTEMNIRHAPFLTGKGWTQSKGATWAEANELCKQLDVTLKVMETSDTGLVYAQEPMPGTPMPIGANTPLKVWFDGNPVAIPPLDGETFASPIPVTDPNGDGIAVVPIDITAAHANDSQSEISPKRRKDVFFELPPAALNREVKIRQLDPSEPVMITVFRRSAGELRNIPDGELPYTGKKGDQPTLEYRHDSNDIVIMVEFDRRNTGKNTLRIEW